VIFEMLILLSKVNSQLGVLHNFILM